MAQIEIQYLWSLIQKIFRGIEFKLISGALVGVLSFFYDNVYQDAMLAIFFLLIFDFITGVVAGKKLKKQIKSGKVFRTAQKMAIYFLLISAGYLAETATHRMVPVIDEGIMGFLALTELISIIENVGFMGYAIPKKLLNQLTKLKNQKYD